MIVVIAWLFLQEMALESLDHHSTSWDNSVESSVCSEQGGV